MPRIPLGYAENFRKFIDLISLVRIELRSRRKKYLYDPANAQIQRRVTEKLPIPTREVVGNLSGRKNVRVSKYQLPRIFYSLRKAKNF